MSWPFFAGESIPHPRPQRRIRGRTCRIAGKGRIRQFASEGIVSGGIPRWRRRGDGNRRLDGRSSRRSDHQLRVEEDRAPSAPAALRAAKVRYDPEPLRDSRRPSRFSSRSARSTVGRLAPNLRASASSLGKRSCDSYLPFRISRLSVSATARYFAVRPAMATVYHPGAPKWRRNRLQREKPANADFPASCGSASVKFTAEPSDDWKQLFETTCLWRTD